MHECLRGHADQDLCQSTSHAGLPAAMETYHDVEDGMDEWKPIKQELLTAALDVG